MLFSDLSTIYRSVNKAQSSGKKLISWKFIAGILLLIQCLIKSFTGNYFLEQTLISICLAGFIQTITELARYPIRKWLFKKLDDLRNNRTNNLWSLAIVLLSIVFVYLWIRILTRANVRLIDAEQEKNLTKKCPKCIGNMIQFSLMGVYYMYAVPGFLIAVSLMSNSKSKQQYVSLSTRQRRVRFCLVSVFRSAFAVPILMIYTLRHSLDS